MLGRVTDAVRFRRYDRRREAKNETSYGRCRGFSVDTPGSDRAACRPDAEQDSPDIRLVLQLTVDGLRADLLTRGADRFGEDGFHALLARGTVFATAHYRHANTETIVGHATLATGAHPSVHGMTGNVWYDAEAGELTYNIEDPDSPLLPVREEQQKGEQVDPAQLISRTQGRSPRTTAGRDLRRQAALLHGWSLEGLRHLGQGPQRRGDGRPRRQGVLDVDGQRRLRHVDLVLPRLSVLGRGSGTPRARPRPTPEPSGSC